MELPKQPILASLTPFTRILFSVLLVISCYAVGFFAGLLLAGPLFDAGISDLMSALTDIDNEKTLQILQYFQVIQSICMFIVPPLIAGYLFGGSSQRYLFIDRKSPAAVYLFTALLMFTCLPFINWMISANEGIGLPGFLSGVEDWMKATEAEAARLTDAFLNMPSFGALMFNILMIALLPAIGEELMFRGLVQRLFREWLGNVHLAIFIAAFLFSAMHLQFYGFFPRMALGIIFGYLFYWSGSIWVPVFAHFVNNGAAVVVSYLSQRNVLSMDFENFGASDSIAVLLLSGLSVPVLLFMVYRWQHADVRVKGET